jgi:2-iminobutanoate/2-iminopropanoate deaminase
MSSNREIVRRHPLIEPLHLRLGSHLSLAARAGNLIFASGMLSIDPTTGDYDPGTIEHETHRALSNLQQVLTIADSDLSLALQVHAYIHDRSDYAAMNVVYGRFFPDRPPSRTVRSSQIEKGLKVKFDAVALARTI